MAAFHARCAVCGNEALFNLIVSAHRQQLLRQTSPGRFRAGRPYPSRFDTRTQLLTCASCGHPVQLPPPLPVKADRRRKNLTPRRRRARRRE